MYFVISSERSCSAKVIIYPTRNALLGALGSKEAVNSEADPDFEDADFISENPEITNWSEESFVVIKGEIVTPRESKTYLVD